MNSTEKNVTGTRGLGDFLAKQPKWRWTALGLGLMLVACVVWPTLVGLMDVSAEQVRSEIEEGLPIGSHRNSVEVWLKTRAYQYHEINDTNGNVRGLGGKMYCNKLIATGCVIAMEFYFDKDGKLTGFVVRRVGPMSL